MTRIYTNIPSMVAQTNLHRNMASLETSLERLSTGFKINSGADDPAGLIASEMLRSDITGIKTAIKNTERANMMIATADSALNEVANLLNDIRGLVTEAANTGAMSAEMIAANQLQVDASLDAIDRIAAQTSFMGQKLLDGSLDFDMTGVNRNDVQSLAVHQVNFGADKTPVNVEISVRQAAEKAALYYNNPALADDIILQWGGNLGYSTQSFQRGASVEAIAKAVNATSNSTGVIAEVGSDAIQGTLYTSSLGAGNDIIITAGNAGVNGGNVEIKYLKGNSEGIYVDYQESLGDGSPAKLNVYLQTEEYKSSVAKLVDTSPGVNDDNALKFTANIKGDQYNNSSINFVDGRFTQADWGADATNPYGVAGHQYAYYNDQATKSTALFGNVNGMSMTNFDEEGQYFAIQAKQAGANYNDVAVMFVEDTAHEIPSGKTALARYVEETDDTTGEVSKKLRIYIQTGTTTVSQVADALKLEGHFELTTSSSDVGGIVLEDTYDDEEFDPGAGDDPPPGYSNTHSSGGDAGTLFIVMPPNGVDPDDNPITANDIVKMFDINDQASRGSERAADLFTVERTADNTGEGTIQIYDYVTQNDDGDDITVKTKPEFYQVFEEGVTGDKIVTTAAELVTALNNSAYWGMSMCPELLAELTAYNAQGTYFDLANPPVLTAKLAPGNHGLFTVSAFEEVAYYGDPNDGTGLQFLGEKNSPSIRFVAGGTEADPKAVQNDHLWIDKTTAPDKVDFSQAVLTATNPNASLIITANKKGGEYDDVQFLFKRINEDPNALDDPDTAIDPNRKDGWVEYDPGKSFAESQSTFKTTEGYDIANSAFFVTATERGDMYNNVKVVMTVSDSQSDPVDVKFDKATNQLRVSLFSGNLTPPEDGLSEGDDGWYKQIDTNDVIAAINKADVGFKASLSYSQDQSNMLDFSAPDSTLVPPYEPLTDEDGNPYPSASNNGTGTFELFGLKTNQYTQVGDTKDSGGHSGTVTVWLADQETVDPDDGTVSWAPPDANQVLRLINNDQVVGPMFSARAYTSGPNAGKGNIDFVKDTNIVSSGGLVERGAITVHLVTDKNGLVQTTAKDLAEWWQKQDPAYVDNISASIVRPAGAVWDECNDPYGFGLLEPTVTKGDCDEDIINDIRFVGWNDDVEKQEYVATYATGTMTSDNGEDSSYDLIARRVGPDYNGYKIVYIDDAAVTGKFADNYVEGSDQNPCNFNPFVMKKDDCGNPILPTTSSTNGMYLELDPNAKTINIHIRKDVTTAYDVEQLIETDPYTKYLFTVEQHGDGSGVVSLQDDTILTTGGALPPGGLNGAKLLFGAEATDYFLIFKSSEYGSDQFVDIQASGQNGKDTSFKVYDTSGKVAEKVYGQDVDALINGIKAVGSGLGASLNTSNLSLDFTFSEDSGTSPGFATDFTITGGGATYQVGPDVVSNQQITIGIQSANTVKLGGASGKLYELRSGQDADLTTDTNKAYRIVQDAIVSIATTRGRLGTLQRATFDTNINVLGDTLEAITAAESQIRDTDFAEETSNLTRAQILVQSNISTLGIANQIPNYMLGLIGR